MTSEITEVTEITDPIQTISEQKSEINTVSEIPQKKPRKPLSEETKQKLAETLKKAREAKLYKNKQMKEQAVTPQPAVVVPKPKPMYRQVQLEPEYVKPEKTMEEKIKKRIKKEVELELLIESKFEDIKQKKDASKLNSKHIKTYKNLF